MAPSDRIVPELCAPSIVAATPIYFVGDSNALMFRHLLVHEAQHFAKPIATTGCFVPGLSAHSIAREGALHERVLAFLRGTVLARPADVGMTGGTDAQALAERTLVQRFNPPIQDEWNVESQPTVVFLLGTVDIMALSSQIGPAADFASQARYDTGIFEHPKLPLLPASAVEALVRSRLAPLAEALGIVRALGLANLYVHSLMPPSLDDAEYFRVRGVACSAKLRYKLALSINRELRDIAERSGAAFLDLWPSTTIDGVRDPRYALDTDHLNRAAAALTLHALMRAIIVRRSQPVDRDDEDATPY